MSLPALGLPKPKVGAERVFLPDLRAAFGREVEEVVAVDVVEVVPEVGVHDDAVDAKTGVGVDIGFLQDIATR